MYEMLHVGFNCHVPKSEVAFIINADTSPTVTKGLIDEAKNNNKLVDVTKRKRRRSLVVTKSGYVFVSTNSADNLARRFGATDLKATSNPDTLG